MIVIVIIVQNISIQLGVEANNLGYFFIGSYTNNFGISQFLMNSDTQSSYLPKFAKNSFNIAHSTKVCLPIDPFRQLHPWCQHLICALFYSSKANFVQSDLCSVFSPCLGHLEASCCSNHGCNLGLRLRDRLVEGVRGISLFLHHIPKKILNLLSEEL